MEEEKQRYDELKGVFRAILIRMTGSVGLRFNRMHSSGMGYAKVVSWKIFKS